MKKDTQRFDSEVFYGLLACIVAGRSWNSIVNGIDVVKYNSNEVNLVKIIISLF